MRPCNHHLKSPDSSGFTLIELLIVVAIIAILAAIAVPNFLEAQTRAKVARVKSDERSIATAIEAYATDNSRYSFVNRVPGWALPVGPVPSQNVYAAGLTTPISYMTSAPSDPFGGHILADDKYFNENVTENYWYGTREFYDQNGWYWFVSTGPGQSSRAIWVVESRGPDLHWARLPPNGIGVVEVDDPFTWSYDPTNGTVSSGNIARSGP